MKSQFLNWNCLNVHWPRIRDAGIFLTILMEMFVYYQYNNREKLKQLFLLLTKIGNKRQQDNL